MCLDSPLLFQTMGVRPLIRCLGLIQYKWGTRQVTLGFAAEARSCEEMSLCRHLYSTSVILS